MPTDHLPSLFNAYGQLSQDVLNALTENDLGLMTEDERAALANVIESDATVQAAEQRVVDARKRMAELTAQHDAAHNALIAIRGPVDPVAEAKRVIALHNGVTQRDPTIAELTKTHADIQAKARALDAKSKKSGTDDDAAALNAIMVELVAARDKLERARKIEAATVALDQAVVDLAEARAEYHAATVAVNPARSAFGAALLAWDGFRKRLSHWDLQKQAAAQTAEAALAAVKANPVSTDPRDLPIARAFQHRKEVARSTRRAYAPPPPVRGSLIPQPTAPRPASGQRTRS